MNHHLLYIVVTTLHVLAAIFWTGSLLFMSLLLVPALRSLKNPPLMAQMIQTVGKRYRIAGWISLAVLVVTGYAALSMRGIGVAMLTDPAFWSSPFGQTLGWKLALFASVVGLSLAHDLMSGSRLKVLRETNPAAAERQRRIASWMGRITLILSLALVILAIMLVRGRPW